MNSEKVASRMIEQTCNLMSSGGCAFEAIRAGDMQALYMCIEATPLTWSFFEAKYKIQPKEPFKEKLVYWMHNRLLNQRHLNPEYIERHHVNAVFAAHDLSEGFAAYLARHKVKNEALSPWFKYLKVGKHQFNRKYAPFLRECKADLEQELQKLEIMIHERTKND